MVTAPDYTVRLEQVFQGPMDLLLHLVREQEVEIHEVELSRVIAGYLEHLEALRELDIELAGDFLVMAATLMAIKSRSLLPHEEVDLEDELDPRDELIQRLLEYRRFKEASEGLERGRAERARLQPRGAFPELRDGAGEPTLDLGEISKWDLLSAFSRLMRETLASRTQHVAGDPRPLRYYVGQLAHRARDAGRLSLHALLERIEAAPSRETLVGAFCALLELIRLGVLSAEQSEHEGEILVQFCSDVEGDIDHLLDAATFDDEVEAADEPAGPSPPDGDATPAPAASRAGENSAGPGGRGAAHGPYSPSRRPGPQPRPGAQKMSSALDVTESTWETAVLKSEIPVLIDFWAEWCGPCKAMGPFVDKLAEELDGRLKVVKLDTQEYTEVASRYGIISIPTFLLVKNGEVAHQIVGALPYEKLKAAVEAHL